MNGAVDSLRPSTCEANWPGSKSGLPMLDATSKATSDHGRTRETTDGNDPGNPSGSSGPGTARGTHDGLNRENARDLSRDLHGPVTSGSFDTDLTDQTAMTTPNRAAAAPPYATATAHCVWSEGEPATGLDLAMTNNSGSTIVLTQTWLRLRGQSTGHRVTGGHTSHGGSEN